MNNYKKLVWSEIQKYLKNPVYPDKFQIPQKYNPDSIFHWKLVNDYPERQGKYIRPTLLILTAEAMGIPIKKAIKTAAAMQISEDWLLIHDDIEDNSMLRRGKPALHKIYGVELAINAGDTLQTIMWKVLSDNKQLLGSKKANEIANEFYLILSRTELGQTAEISWTQNNKLDFSDDDWFFVCDGKTSYYTIAGPMRLGAIIAGASKSQLASITKFGINLGRCFQLVDDILDLTSDFSGLKKQTGNDIYEGKRTLILGHLLRTANKSDKQKIVKILAKTREQKTPEEVHWIIQKMSDYGSIIYATKLAETYKDNAQKIFKTELKFLTKQPAREELEKLINFIFERKC